MSAKADDAYSDWAALIARFPGVRLDHVNKHFYRGLLDGELRLSRCTDCGWWHHRPKRICPRCWSKRVVATPVTGGGRIHLVTFLYQGPSIAGVSYDPPHPVVTVELDEQQGLRYTSTVSGAGNDEITIGSRVTLDWVERESRPFPLFRLVS